MLRPLRARSRRPVRTVSRGSSPQNNCHRDPLFALLLHRHKAVNRATSFLGASASLWGFWQAAAGIVGWWNRMALAAAGFLYVKVLVGFIQQFFDAFAVAAIDGDADAGGKRRLLFVVFHNGANAVGDALGFDFLGFRENEREFVAAVASSGVDGAAMDTENISQSADGAAADKVAVGVINFLETVNVEEKNGEGATGAVGAFGFVFENIKQAAVVCQTGKRIADGEMADLFEKARVIEKRAAKRDGVAHDGKRLREDKRRVENALRLGCGKLRGDVKPGGSVDGAIEGRVFHEQAAAIPKEA